MSVKYLFVTFVEQQVCNAYLQNKLGFVNCDVIDKRYSDFKNNSAIAL